VQTALLLVALLCIFFRNVVFSDSTLLTATFVSGTMPQGPYGYSGYAVLDVPVRDAGATGWTIEPWDKLISRMYQSGQLPLWNPHQAGGAPLAANMQSAPFFPLNAPIYLVPQEYWPYAKDLTLLFQLFVAGFFTFLFARTVGIGRIGALGAATAFMVCGYLVLYLGLPHQRAEILIPAVLYAFERVVSRSNLSSILFAATVVCFSILGGMPEAFFLSFFFAGFYYIYRMLEQMIDRGLGLSFVVSSVGHAVGAAALGVLLSSFCLLPFIEFLLLSYHAHPPGVGFAQYAPATAISTLVPYFLGGAQSGWQPPYSTMWSVPYVGILPVALALLALRRYSKGPRLGYFFAGFSVFFLLKAYGAPLVNWVSLLPGFSVTIFPKYGAPEFSFCVAMLAGLGLERVYHAQVSLRRVLITGGLLVAVVGAFFLYHRQAMIEYDVVEYVLDEARVALVFILLFSVPFLLLRLASLVASSSRFQDWRRQIVAGVRPLDLPTRVGEEGVTRLLQSLRDRKLYLLVLLSAVLLFLGHRAGLLASSFYSMSLYSIDVGDENDEAYVQGFHQRERNEWDGSFFRWSKAHSSIVLPGARNVPLVIRLAINGWRPEDQAAPEVRVSAHGRELARFTAEKELRTYEFRYTPAVLSPAKDLVLEISSDTFAPPTDQAQRTLGVVVRSLQATPIAGPWWCADWVSIAALSVAIAISYLVLHSLGATPSSSLVGALILLALLCCAMTISGQAVARLSLYLPLLVPALCGLCYAALRVVSPRGSKHVSVALLGLLVVELLVYLPKERAQRYDPFVTPPYVEFLKEDPEKYRVMGLDLVLYPDTASAHGIDDMENLDAMNVGRYSAFIRRFICPNCRDRVTSQGSPLFDSEILDLSNIEYLLTIYPLEGRWRTERWMTPALLETCQTTAPQGGVVSADEQWTIQGDTRLVLLQSAGSRLDCPLKVPDRLTMLRFGVGMDPTAWRSGETEGDGVLCEVYVTSSGSQHTVFSKYIDPKIRPAEMKWHDAYVDLTPYRGQDVTLSLVTSPGSDQDDRGDWAGWSELALVKASPAFAELPGWAWTPWLSRSAGPDAHEEKWELVYEDEIRVYRNNQVLPRAFIVHHAQVVTGETEVLDTMDSPSFDPRTTVVLEEELPAEIVQALELIAPEDGSTARIVDYDPGRVSIETTLGSPGFLVLSDTYYPGWRVSVDGHESTIYAADYLFRAVYLEAGKHSVEFIYDPLSFKLGFSLGVGTLLGILAYVIMTKAR
jgi:hypothetical protein